MLSYFNITCSLLREISVPVHWFSCPIDCHCIEYRDCISQYYNCIVISLCSLCPLTGLWIPFKCLKPFWSDELDTLKETSLDMHSLWRQCCQSRSGIINSAHTCAIKIAANGEIGQTNTKIPLDTPVNMVGCSDLIAIAESFSRTYAMPLVPMQLMKLMIYFRS